MNLFRNRRSLLTLVCAAFAMAVPAVASETCTAGPDLDPQTRGSLETTARSVYNMSARGDVFHLKQNAAPVLASSFGGVEQAITDNKANFTGAQATLRGVYLLDASGDTGSVARAEFFCGIFNSNDRTGFILNNLPAGKYAITIQDAKGGKNPVSLSVILQDVGSTWKIAGFYVKQSTAAGHDGQWYWDQAKQLEAKGQKHTSYFYLVEARDLLAPVPFMTTPDLDKLYDDTQAAIPSDLPVNGPVSLLGPDGKTYQLTSAAPIVVQDGLALLLKQQVPDASDNGAAFQANMGLMKAAIAKWPELRETFASVVARAQDAKGGDYGSLLKMQDIK